jgi:tRNA modification GTPase
MSSLLVVLKDTIAAIATPLGTGGIGIIRVSGVDAVAITHLIFKPSKPLAELKSHHLHHGEILSPETNTTIDEVLVAFMKGPHSFTGEDTLEIYCHGGPLIVQTILTEIIKAGARPAESGEFTKRAFLNNRIDLSQAEAIAEMISAQSQEGLKIAISQLKGHLSRKLETVSLAIMDVLVLLESAIDFPEDNLLLPPPENIVRQLQLPMDELHALLASYEQGRLYRQGIHAVITGKPNVGKSSLLNNLVGTKRAIVSHIPGTTRDFIHETAQIKGISVQFIDTAGIRPPENAIEKAGVDLAWEKFSAADVVIIVLDGSGTLMAEDVEILEKNKNPKCVIAINKNDLPHRLNEEKLHDLMPLAHPLWISAKYGEGIPALKDALYALIDNHSKQQLTPDVMITNMRHKVAIEKAFHLLSQAQKVILHNFSFEFAAMDLREALDTLGEVTGKTIHDDVLDKIFSTFCIGK